MGKGCGDGGKRGEEEGKGEMKIEIERERGKGGRREEGWKKERREENG